MKFEIYVFIENLLRKSKIHKNLTRITGTLHTDQYICMTISSSVLLRMKNFSDKVIEKTKTHIFIQ